MSQDSIVGIVTRLQTGEMRKHVSIPSRGKEIFPFSKASGQALETT
jgi:hypothetical protein